MQKVVDLENGMGTLQKRLIGLKRLETFIDRIKSVELFQSICGIKLE